MKLDEHFVDIHTVMRVTLYCRLKRFFWNKR